MPDFAISCVVDDDARFRGQALNWIASLHAVGALTELQPFVHHVGKAPPAFLGKMRECGAELVEIEPFGRGSAAYCNKLQQLDTFAALPYRCVVLCDTDIAFIKNPVHVAKLGGVHAKVVDKANPAEDVLRALLTAAGFDAPLDRCPDFAPEGHTHALNCNGGLYVLERSALRALAEPWKQWSRFCLEQEIILKQKVAHADQLGFLLSMLELGLPFAELPTSENFPTHFSPDSYAQAELGDLGALHYHRRYDRDGFLLPTGYEAVDEFVRMANDAIRRGRTELEIDFGRLST